MRRRYDANNRAFKAELEKFDKIMQEGFVPPLFDGEDPKLKYAGLSGPYAAMTEHRHNALDRQVGGTHYKDFAIQPIEFIHANEIGFIEGCAIKYLCRWRAKGGIQDLQKVQHYVQMLIQLESNNE